MIMKVISYTYPESEYTITKPKMSLFRVNTII